MKKIVVCALLLLSHAAHAQWAVLDEEVRKLVYSINQVKGGSGKLDDLPDISNVDVDFVNIALKNPERFIGTVADCGDQKLNLNHYNACMGLRNLRLTTLHDTVELVKGIVTRDKQIKDVIAEGDSVEDSGKLQRLHFKLVGLQTRMQNEAMKLQMLHFGYKQREKMYEQQMAEARRATDTRQPDALVKMGPVPFIKPPRGW